MPFLLIRFHPFEQLLCPRLIETRNAKSSNASLNSKAEYILNTNKMTLNGLVDPEQPHIVLLYTTDTDTQEREIDMIMDCLEDCLPKSKLKDFQWTSPQPMRGLALAEEAAIAGNPAHYLTSIMFKNEERAAQALDWWKTKSVLFDVAYELTARTSTS